ncbi:hypothetical protein VDGD_20012 [Verticillium dahliae]|nr:hypothetical protein VDGD_20012 [Verticillium dahliae]
MKTLLRSDTTSPRRRRRTLFMTAARRTMELCVLGQRLLASAEAASLMNRLSPAATASRLMMCVAGCEKGCDSRLVMSCVRSRRFLQLSSAVWGPSTSLRARHRFDGGLARGACCDAGGRKSNCAGGNEGWNEKAVVGSKGSSSSFNGSSSNEI